MCEFVNFSIAKKLKEKGFPQHISDEVYIIDNYGEEEYDIGDRLPIPLVPDYMDDAAAPTISQVLKWLRKKKNIFVVTFIADDSDTPLTYEIYMGTECLLTHHGEYFTLQEWDKCNLVGIEYVIDNLIENEPSR